MIDQLLDTWDINNRINLYLLEDINPAHLGNYSASKGRNVGEQIAHIHNVRLMWLKQASPELFKKVCKIEKGEDQNFELLKNSLIDSSEAIRKMISTGIIEEHIKGFKPHPVAFVGYIISHESHHRGQIILTLKQSGQPVSKKVAYGIWEWGTK